MGSETHFFRPNQQTNIWTADSEHDEAYMKKAKVEMEVHLLSIDPKNGTFTASVRCNILARFPKAEDEMVKDLIPCVRIPSCDVEEKEARVFKESKLSTASSTMWRGILSFKLSGFESFEVQDFPFDRQIIDISLLDFRWLPGRGAMEITDFEVRTYCKLADWDAYFAVVEALKPKKSETGDLQYAGRYSVKLRLERRPEYYITNIFLVAWGILIASLLPLGMSVTEVGDRLSIYSGGVLTLVAFNYSVAEQLPSVPYSTLADMFLLGLTGTLVFTMVEALICHKLEVLGHVDIDAMNKFEDGMLIFLAVLWLLILLYLAVFRKHFRRTWPSVLAAQETAVPEKSGD
uniref:Neurotransmitter-gated ion-channel ligand-binding domain-containing protein n=1 Tax=Alexandrium monilatum TaxID=311494 RepID=A0A7S4Q0B5_9DINO|mmetsp:Transcript_74195/g.229336  ORF Transcript_74195/g.229336 Transcript_74195/m.229336 type:complete len:347 (+) Transcript_74195:69-1109(+)